MSQRLDRSVKSCCSQIEAALGRSPFCESWMIRGGIAEGRIRRWLAAAKVSCWSLAHGNETSAQLASSCWVSIVHSLVIRSPLVTYDSTNLESRLGYADGYVHSSQIKSCLAPFVDGWSPSRRGVHPQLPRTTETMKDATYEAMCLEGRSWLECRMLRGGANSLGSGSLKTVSLNASIVLTAATIGDHSITSPWFAFRKDCLNPAT